MGKKVVKIGFLGVGSIGSLFGGYLAASQSDEYSLEVVFICRKSHAEAIQKSGLKLQKGETIHEIKSIKTYWSLEDNTLEDVYFDFLFLCVKTYDIKSALAQYKDIVASSKRLVILQNGIGNEEIIKEYCSKEKLMRIVTSNGALLREPGFVIHTGLGYTKLGIVFSGANSDQAQADLKLLIALLNVSGIKVDVSDDISKDCWEKIFVNIGINPFGALTRLKNGKLLESEGLKALMAEAVREAVKVAKAKKVGLSNKNYVELMFDVAVKTAENKNSMLQDVLKGKRTEIAYMNGRIVKYAEGLEIEVPINKLLTYLVKGLEGSINKY